MASIRSQGGVIEIRECVSTARGPRQRALARFRGVLTPEVLDRAAAAARRPFDRRALIDRARARGISVAEQPRSSAARRLLADLRAGRSLDPTLVTLLREALAGQEGRALPDHLVDPAEWLGRSEAARGRALRGLLRVASRVARSRARGVEAEAETGAEGFPRFDSGERFAS